MTSRGLIQSMFVCGCIAAALAAPARADNDDNPPGAEGGAGTNWENRPGVAGGPGASPGLRFWSREAWDEFCAENPERCGDRRGVGYGPDPDSLDLGGAEGTSAAEEKALEEKAVEEKAGETSAAADAITPSVTEVRQD